MSGPKARKAVLFKRAVQRNRRREQPLRREPDGAFEQNASHDATAVGATGVRALQMKIRAAFGDADAA